MSATTACKSIKVDLNIGDQLTSISCGHIVVEIIKFLAYQRLQIPYRYQWLKEIINKRKSFEDKQEGYNSERHFYVASTALSNLDFIIKSLLKEIDSVSLPEEVCIVLGSTPFTCKEVYRLILPKVFHKQQCHSKLIASDQKIQMTIFRMLVTSDTMNKVLFNVLPPTNMYIFIKKNLLNNQEVICSDNFEWFGGCKFPRSSKVVCLDFRSCNVANVSCCNDFQIFGNTITENVHCSNDDEDSDFTGIESTDDQRWFQSTYIMKGFKDCIINGTSVTNSWLHP